jgi:hypothetical protein
MRRERTGMPCLTFRAQFRQRLGIKKVQVINDGHVEEQ